MTTQELIQSIEKTFKECIEIVKKKNADYTNGQDAFGNFRFAQLIGVDVERAILVRMSDKLARLSNILKNKEAKVKDESYEDTINDLINYAAILKAFLKEKKLEV